MTIGYTYTTPAEGGALDLDTGGTLTETIWDALLSNILRLGSTDGGIARVSTQFDKTDTSLANITGLSLAVAAGQTYAFRAVLSINYTSPNGFKVAISGTCTATSIIAEVLAGWDNAAGFYRLARLTALDASSGNNGTGATVATVCIEGIITVNAAGTLTIQFAQNSTGGTSSVLVGSCFQLRSA